METGYDINHLFQQARSRWLKPGEVLFILQNYDHNLISHQPPQMPTSGSLLLFNRKILPSFRKDGHHWQKKRNRNSVAEGHERLKVDNFEALNCYYAHGEDNCNFHRRSYWMLNEENKHIVLVHYRDTTELQGNTNSASVSEFSRGQSYTLSQSVNNFVIENQGNASLSDLHGSNQSLCSPSSLEVSSWRVAERQCMDHSANLDSATAGSVSTSSNVNVSPVLQGSTELLGLDDGILIALLAFDNQKQTTDDKAVLGCDNCVEVLDQVATMQHLEYYGRDDGLVSDSTDLATLQELASLLNPQEAEIFRLTCSGITACATNIPDCNSVQSAPGQFQMPLSADSNVTITQENKFMIREISPEWGFANEATKVMIIGSFLCNPLEIAWTCMFGDMEVPIRIIQDGVLCCQAPPNCPGNVTFCITSGNRKACSEFKNFEYRDRNSTRNDCIRLQQEENRSTEEVQLLVKFVQMLLSNSSLQKGDGNNFNIHPSRIQKGYEVSRDYITAAHLTDCGTSSDTIDCVLLELIKDKLQQWLPAQILDGKGNLNCTLSKKEQEIIHLAAGLGYEWALDPILRSGVGVNVRDTGGWTALHWAARFGREKMVAALIASGASGRAVTDPTAQDPIGKNPASIADANGHKGLAGYLSELALTSHFSSLTFEEAGSVHVEAELDISNVSMECVASVEDQGSMKEVLAANRNASQAAALIQAAFRAHSFKKRQEREAADRSTVDEYGFTPDEIQYLSAVFFPHSRHHNAAALTIQKYYRGWKRCKGFLTLRQKVVKIQAHIRGYRVRKYYRVIWAVSIMEKIVLRWRRKGPGLRGYKPEREANEEDEDVLKIFRRQKVDTSIHEAVSRVRFMIHSREARDQYTRMLETFHQAKVRLETKHLQELVGVLTNEEALASLADTFSMDNDNADLFQSPSRAPADSPDDYSDLWSQFT